MTNGDRKFHEILYRYCIFVKASFYCDTLGYREENKKTKRQLL
jgi:hypothetical protein